MSRRGWRAAASVFRHASASAADAAPGTFRPARRVPTRRVPEAVGASMTDARATAAFPRSIRRWVAAPDRARPPGRVGGRLSTAARARVAEDDLTSAENDRWETVVGLELHVQLGTATKLFSAAPRRVGETTPNVAVAAFDAAWPGALPSLNRRALALAARLGVALGGVVARRTSFDRKHYHYADQPHGYQITQRREPVVLGGALDVFVRSSKTTNDETKKNETRSRVLLRVERLQLETDTGKSATRVTRDGKESDEENDEGETTEWLVDYNRAGCALVEIVTRPDLRSPEEAAAAVEAFQRAARFLEISDANMEDGSLRADVNVSVRRRSETRDESVFGERCEIKNLNSTRSVRRAVRHEAARQISILERGGAVRRETRGFDAATGTTRALRGKEAIADYRFAPEPDVPAVTLTEKEIAEMTRGVPMELPDAAWRRLVDPEGAHGVSPALADALVAHPTTLDAYERALRAARAEIESDSSSSFDFDASRRLPRTVAHWVTGELVGAVKRAKLARRPAAPLADLPGGARPEAIGELLGLAAAGKCTARMAKAATAAMLVAEPLEPLESRERLSTAQWPTARQTLASLFGEGFDARGSRGGTEDNARAEGSEDERGTSAHPRLDRDDDDVALRALCVAVVGEKQTEAALFRGGKTRLLGAFVGEVMRRTEGRADPRRAAEFVKEALSKES
jgi:aspartyl-tRNA(Asn)/glutamyl-tRNA(Gln) amidotransferase subunit B